MCLIHCYRTFGHIVRIGALLLPVPSPWMHLWSPVRQSSSPICPNWMHAWQSHTRVVPCPSCFPRTGRTVPGSPSAPGPVPLHTSHLLACSAIECACACWTRIPNCLSLSSGCVIIVVHDEVLGTGRRLIVGLSSNYEAIVRFLLSYALVGCIMIISILGTAIVIT